MKKAHKHTEANEDTNFNFFIAHLENIFNINLLYILLQGLNKNYTFYLRITYFI
jgi:hypothetical protein